MFFFDKFRKWLVANHAENRKRDLCDLLIHILSIRGDIWNKKFVDKKSGMDATLLYWSANDLHIGFGKCTKKSNAFVIYSHAMDTVLEWNNNEMLVLPQAVTLNFEKLDPWSVILVNSAVRTWVKPTDNLSTTMFNAIVRHELGHSLFKFREPGMVDSEKFADRVAFLNGAPNGILLVLAMFYSLIKHSECVDESSLTSRLIYALSLLRVKPSVTEQVLDELDHRNIQSRFFPNPDTKYFSNYWYLVNDAVLFWSYMNFISEENQAFRKVITAATLLGSEQYAKMFLQDTKKLIEKEDTKENQEKFEEAIKTENFQRVKLRVYLGSHRDYFYY